MPLFLFQEGNNLAVAVDQHGQIDVDDPPQSVESILRELARLTGGAFAKFDVDAATKLGELLRAVAAFVAGGTRALGNLRTEGARKLLGQLK